MRLQSGIIIFLVSSIFWGCGKETTSQERTIEKGLYGYIVSNKPIKGSFEYYDHKNSKFSLELGYAGNINARKIVEYNWYVQHKKENSTYGEKVEYTSVDVNRGVVSTFDGFLIASPEFDLTQTEKTLGLDTSSLDIGDAFYFTSELVFDNGLIVDKDNITQLIDTSIVENVLFDFEITLHSGLGTRVEIVYSEAFCWDEWRSPGYAPEYKIFSKWVEVSPLEFKVEHDFMYCALEACYMEGKSYNPNLRIKISENKLYPQGKDQWGDSYEFPDVRVNSDTLFLSITNTYGDQVRAVLKRLDDLDWPPLEAL